MRTPRATDMVGARHVYRISHAAYRVIEMELRDRRLQWATADLYAALSDGSVSAPAAFDQMAHAW